MFFFETETRIERVKIKNLSDLSRAFEMLDLAKKTVHNGEIPFINSKGEISAHNYDQYCKLVEEDIRAFAKNNIFDYDPQILSSNINTLLEKNNLRVSWLEKTLDVSAGYISRTSGEKKSGRKLSIDIVAKIANLFDVSLERLVNSSLSIDTEELEPAIKYIETLRKQTTNNTLHWKKLYEATDYGIMKAWEEFFEKKKHIERINMVPREEAYITSAYGGDILISLVTLPEKEHSGYVVCHGIKNIKVSGNSDYYDVTEIFNTIADPSGALEDICRYLISDIESHEESYILPDNVKSYLFDYLKHATSLSDTNQGGDKK